MATPLCYTVIIPFFIALFLVGWIHPKLVKIALLKNIVDNPDARKLQRTPVPVLGGVAVFFGVVIAIGCMSAVVDCFDGRPAGWRIGPSPTAALANGSLADAVAARRAGARTVVHSDRGGHYRWPGWVALCEGAGLVRSMSAKGCSPDNAACEGFFGRLKNEFFHCRDWEGVPVAEFGRRLDAYLRYYCSGRIKRSLGWLSPDEYRASLGYAV